MVVILSFYVEYTKSYKVLKVFEIFLDTLYISTEKMRSKDFDVLSRADYESGVRFLKWYWKNQKRKLLVIDFLVIHKSVRTTIRRVVTNSRVVHQITKMTHSVLGDRPYVIYRSGSTVPWVGYG